MPKDVIDEISGIDVPTYSGCRVSLTHPEPWQINFVDVMRGMCMNAAHQGCTAFFYSMAQRSVISSYLAEDMYDLDYARAAMLCMTPVVYMGSVPIKLRGLFPEATQMFDNIAETVYAKCDVGIENRGMTLFKDRKLIDLNAMMRSIENRDLRENPDVDFSLPDPLEEVIIAPMTVSECYVAYRDRLRELGLSRRVEIEFPWQGQSQIAQKLIKPGAC